MVIETKFGNEDSVYYLNSKSELKLITVCEKCGGSGELELLNGGSVQCNRCHGRGGESRVLWLNEPSKNTSKIGRVGALIYGKESKNRKNKIEYMLYATGIGTGRVHNESLLFKELKECEEYCNIENAKSLIVFDREYGL